MGRPLAGFGFFSAEKKLDAMQEKFEKVKVHAFIEGGDAVEDAIVIKQTGYNKYLVSAKAEPSRQGIVMLVDKKDAKEAGQAYMTVLLNEDQSEHSVRKMVRNFVETFDGLVLTYQYEVKEVSDGPDAQTTHLEGKFVTDKKVAECKVEVDAAPAPAKEAPAKEEAKSAPKAQKAPAKAEAKSAPKAEAEAK